MTQIAFLLMAHKAPDKVAAQVRMLTAQGDCVALHYDANAPWSEWLTLLQALAGLPRVHLMRSRLRGGWGTWSLVSTTLRLMGAALQAFPQASHFYLISGDCMPIRPRAALAAHLAPGDRDFIEGHDFFRSDWIQTGMKEDRLIYRHPFNERRQRRLFYLGLWLQRVLGLRRSLPKGLSIRIGSQWWCLRRETVRRVLDHCAANPDLIRFFRTVWIPDEVFFQSLVPHLLPHGEIDGQILTRLMFSDYGMPVTFHADQIDMLKRQQGFFLRKLADGADGLRRELAAHYARPQDAGPPVEGPDMTTRHRWLARRGRDGRRSPPPPWSQMPPQVTVIVCKKWHVAHRVARRTAQETGARALASVFDETASHDPDLGGFAASPAERRGAPMAYLSRAAEAYAARHLLVCIDPCQDTVIAALAGVGARILRLDCASDPAFVAAHSHRIGLDGALTDAVQAELAGELAVLDRRINGAAVVVTHRDPPSQVARCLSRTLDIPPELAIELSTQLELTS